MMDRCILDQSQLKKFDEMPDCVHYDGVASVSTMTLCGAVDWMGARWIKTTRRVNCSGCIAVRDHVMGRPRDPASCAARAIIEKGKDHA
jgi:hypothetical protein